MVSTDEPKPSVTREWVEFVGALVLAAVLAGACVLATLATAALLSPWGGVLVAVGSFWVWGRFGPPPMPGYLNGIVCLWGHGLILGSLIVCVVLAVG